MRCSRQAQSVRQSRDGEEWESGTHFRRMPGPTGTRLLVLLSVSPTVCSSSSHSPLLIVLANDKPLLWLFDLPSLPFLPLFRDERDSERDSRSLLLLEMLDPSERPKVMARMTEAAMGG